MRTDHKQRATSFYLENLNDLSRNSSFAKEDSQNRAFNFAKLLRIDKYQRFRDPFCFRLRIYFQFFQTEIVFPGSAAIGNGKVFEGDSESEQTVTALMEMGFDRPQVCSVLIWKCISVKFRVLELRF